MSNDKALRQAVAIVKVATTTLEQDMSLRAALNAVDVLLREHPEARVHEQEIRREVVHAASLKGVQ